jgi:hypothetical protein
MVNTEADWCRRRRLQQHLRKSHQHPTRKAELVPEGERTERTEAHFFCANKTPRRTK